MDCQARACNHCLIEIKDNQLTDELCAGLMGHSPHVNRDITDAYINHLNNTCPLDCGFCVDEKNEKMAFTLKQKEVGV